VEPFLAHSVVLAIIIYDDMI